MPSLPSLPTQWALMMNIDLTPKIGVDLTDVNEVFIYDHNGVKDANYQVYFPEQAPNFVPPPSILTRDPRNDFIASPEPGLTNQQLWDKYRVAIAGAVAPSKEIDGDNGEAALARGHALGIKGLVFPIVNAPLAQ